MEGGILKNNAFRTLLGGGQVYVRHRSETKTQSFGQDGDTPFFWTLEGLNFPLLARMLSDIS